MLERKINSTPLSVEMTLEQRKAAIAEHLAWVVANRRLLGHVKFDILLSLINYAEDNWKNAKVTADPKRYDTFNYLFSLENIQKNNIDFVDSVINEAKKITDIKSSLRDEYLSEAETARDRILHPYRRAIDYSVIAGLGVLCLEFSPLTLGAYVVAAASYLKVRECYIEPVYKQVSPTAEKTIIPAYNSFLKHVKNPGYNALSKGLSFTYNFFSSQCRKSRPAANAAELEVKQEVLKNSKKMI